MHKLALKSNPQGWQTFRKRKTDKTFVPLRKKIFLRDKFTCQFCGFQASKYQQIINLDGNYRNKALDNLVTACPLCAHCQFIGSGNFGTIIYLPEYSQAELNQVVRVLFCSMRDDCLYQETAKTLYRSFRNRSKEVDEKFGLDASNSMTFGQTLSDINIPSEAHMEQVFDSLRLLPFRGPLAKPIAYWSTLVDEYWQNSGMSR